MKTIFNTLKKLGNLTAVITSQDGITTISIKPSTTGITDAAVKLIRPLNISINEIDTEEEVCDLIEKHIPAAVETVNGIKSYEDSIKKAESEKAESKVKDEIVSKMKKEHKEYLDLITSDENDKTKHQKLIEKFNKNYSELEEFKSLFNELNSKYNEKYAEADLFS